MSGILWKMRKWQLLLRCKLSKLRWILYRKGFDCAWNVYWMHAKAKEYLLKKGYTEEKMMKSLRNCNVVIFEYGKLERLLRQL